MQIRNFSVWNVLFEAFGAATPKAFIDNKFITKAEIENRFQ